MISYNEDYRKPVYQGKYFSVFWGFFCLFFSSPKNNVKWYKSPASVSFSITFLSVAMSIYSLLVSEIVSATSSYMMFSLITFGLGLA